MARFLAATGLTIIAAWITRTIRDARAQPRNVQPIRNPAGAATPEPPRSGPVQPRPEAISAWWRCPDQETQNEMDDALERLTKHGMVVAAGVCRCGGEWPCATALDLAARATQGCKRLESRQHRS